MKKPIAFWCCLLILIYCLPLFASAHSGRTDGSGGHTDSSTGEYHYHHGYPAHDHWDMDGDGDIDCPYEFKDNTSHSNGLVSSSSNKNNASVPQSEEETKVPAFVYWIIGILVFVILCMFLIIRRKNETIERNERIYRNLQKDEEDKIKEELTALHQDFVKHYGKEYLQIISGAKIDDFLDENNYPHNSEVPSLDQYTFYLGGNPYGSDVKYHHRSCRYARSSYPINAMYLQEYHRYRPCSLCPCRLPDTSWAQRYKKHYEFFKKYIDDYLVKNETESHKIPLLDEPGVKVNYRNRP